MISRIDALEKSVIKDIIITIFMVILSIPLWVYLDKHNINKVGNMYLDYNYINYEELNNPIYNIEPMSDIEGLHFVETKDIIVTNNSNTQDDYYLLLKTSNNVSDKTRININNKVDYLNNYEKIIKDNEIYYVLDYESIVASSQKYVISLWNSEDGKIETIDYNFLVKGEI